MREPIEWSDAELDALEMQVRAAAAILAEADNGICPQSRGRARLLLDCIVREGLAARGIETFTGRYPERIASRHGE